MNALKKCQFRDKRQFNRTNDFFYSSKTVVYLKLTKLGLLVSPVILLGGGLKVLHPRVNKVHKLNNLIRNLLKKMTNCHFNATNKHK